MAELPTGFLCRVCGKQHGTTPLSFSMKVPLAATRIPADEVERRVVITPDQCVIDRERFYLRGRIVIPVHDVDEPFIWGVWAEVSPKSFLRTHAMWMSPGREAEPAFAGYLDTDLALYGSTLNLEVSVHTQVVGRRPHFQIVSAEHPLAREQRDGISLHRVHEIASLLLHAAETTSELERN